MSTLSSFALVLGAAWALPALAVPLARADGCYTCASGSKDACKDYCRYPDKDSFAARKQCETNGCKVVGPAACPTAANYKVCVAPVAPGRPGTVLAAIPWCAATPQG